MNRGTLTDLPMKFTLDIPSHCTFPLLTLPRPNIKHGFVNNGTEKKNPAFRHLPRQTTVESEK